MTAVRKPPFHADHVGSFLRPARLADARRSWELGQLSRAELTAVEDDCVREIVRMQEEVGLKGITDGDFRRNDWFLDFMNAFEGIETTGERFDVPFSGGVTYKAPINRIVRPFRFPEGGVARASFTFLKKTTKETAKLAIPAPSMFYNFVTDSTIDRSAYPDPAAFWSDLSAAYSAAIADYAALGCTYLQIDDVVSANLADPARQEFWKRRRGADRDAMLDAFIRTNNAAVADRPAGMTVAVHMCRGNYQSQYSGTGGYDAVAERYFSESRVDAFFLEYDDERSGGFEPLRFMPRDKTVILGLITSKRPALEPEDEIKRRIEEASKFVAIERLGISPQCGFASTKEGNRLTEDEQRRKLEHIVAIAQEVWGEV